jgi:sugar-specific transcriptional regulator TrmB
MNTDLKEAAQSLAIARQQVDEMHEDYKKIIVLVKMLWDYVDDEKNEIEISTGEEILEMIYEKLTNNYDKAAETYLTLDKKIKQLAAILANENKQDKI